LIVLFGPRAGRPSSQPFVIDFKQQIEWILVMERISFTGDAMSRSVPALPLRRFLDLLLLSVFLLPGLAAQQLSPDLLHGLQWRLIGSYRGGRVTAVAGIAGDPKTYYMGTPGGGVWKTTNACTTWFPIFDAAHVSSISEVIVAPSNPNIVYVATGEQTEGNGVWKSTDAGATWANIGFGDSHWIPSMLVDPHDANLLYVAELGSQTPSEGRGIFKSTDGGKTWRKVFYKDNHTSPTELDFDPADSRTIVAAIRQLPFGRGEKLPEGLDTQLLRSTDAGETWTPLGEQGLPTADRKRVGLSIAPGLGGKRVFALMAQGLFRSDDAGATWQKITSDPRILGSDYFGRVYSDPKNPDVVYVMQTSTYRSTDGGRTFVAWKGTPSGEDDHVLWFAPEDPDRILEGTDQGAVITYDGGKTWNSWFNQPTGQFYRVSTDNSFPYRLYAAQQDSGSVVIPNRSDYGLITYREWFSSGSFESSFIAADPLNSDYVYSLGWYGNIIRLDRRTGQTATVFLAPANYRASWETPITFSPRDPRALYYGSQFLVKTTDGGVTWNEISPDLTVKPSASSPAPKSDEAGHIPSKDDIENTGFFAEDDDQAADANRGFIQAIAPSPLDANLIWVGTSTGLIHITHDGAPWTNVSPIGLPERSTVNEIDPSPHDASTAFAAVSARRDLHPYFFRTRDGGKTWDKIVAGLPEAGSANVIREDPVRKGLLFAGTQTGVYFSFDFGDHWQPLQLTLPTSPVRDLVVHGDDLIAATFGRGLWILDDISPLRQFAGDLQKSPVRFFMPQPAIRVHWDNHPDTPLQSETPAAQNPPDGVILYYFLNSPPKGEITLDVLDQKGTRVRHFSNIAANESLPPANVPEYWFSAPESLPTSAGLNRFVWDLHYPHPTALPYGFFGEHLEYTEYTLPDHAVPGETPRFQPPGPLVPPGDYELVLTVEGKSYHQKLRVVPDPRVQSSSADYAAQFDFSRRLCELMEASASSFRELSQLESQLAERKKSMPASPSKELTDSVADLEKRIDALESGTAQAPGFGTLNRDLGRYLVMVQGGDIAPAKSARDSFQSACEAYAKNVAATGKLTSETLPALNSRLAAEKIAPLVYHPSSASVPACAP
jgi:photosystem II stability/assembly factor-like uncharacterized protein